MDVLQAHEAKGAIDLHVGLQPPLVSGQHFALLLEERTEVGPEGCVGRGDSGHQEDGDEESGVGRSRIHAAILP